MTARKFTRAQIEKILPHRGDALFLANAEVDGLLAHGEAVWSASHPHIRGHFPGLPLVPGIFLVEAAAQLAGIAMALRTQTGEDKFEVLASVRRALFHRPVRPGEPIRYEVRLGEAAVGSFVLAAGTGRDAQERKVATFDLAIGVVERAALLDG